MTWENWNSSLQNFEVWLENDYGPLVRAWWVYLHKLFVKEVTALADPSKLYLDVGCGSGGSLYAVVSESHCQGVGLDPLLSSLKRFKARIKSNTSDINLVLGVAEFLPFRDSAFHLCTMTGSLDHVNDTDKTINEFHRILAPGQYLLVEETVLKQNRTAFFGDTHNTQFTLDSFKPMFRQFHNFKFLRKYPIFSQIKIPDLFLDYSFVHALLSKLPASIGMYFNHSEVIMEFQKPFELLTPRVNLN